MAGCPPGGLGGAYLAKQDNENLCFVVPPGNTEHPRGCLVGPAQGLPQRVGSTAQPREMEEDQRLGAGLDGNLRLTAQQSTPTPVRLLGFPPHQEEIRNTTTSGCSRWAVQISEVKDPLMHNKWAI